MQQSGWDGIDLKYVHVQSTSEVVRQDLGVALVARRSNNAFEEQGGAMLGRVEGAMVRAKNRGSKGEREGEKIRKRVWEGEGEEEV